MFIHIHRKTYTRMSESEVSQSCLTLCDPMDCSLPGFSVHGIFLARVLEWVAISVSRGSSRPRNQARVSLIAGRRFTLSYSELPGKPQCLHRHYSQKTKTRSFPDGMVVKDPPANAGDTGSIPGSGRSHMQWSN